MSTLTIAENCIKFPIFQSVPFGTIFHRDEGGDPTELRAHASTINERMIRNRVFRLELFLAVAVGSLGCFVWQTVVQEKALQQAFTDQSQSIARLTAAVANQDLRITELNLAIEKATQKLAAPTSRISSQLQVQAKAMAAIEIRLRRVENAMRGWDQGSR
jgi:cytoskeletal protein RodZ